MFPQWVGLVVAIVLNTASPILAQNASFNATFGQRRLEIHMNTVETVNLTLTNVNVPHGTPYKFQVRSDKQELAIADKVIEASEINENTKSWFGTFDVQAEFLGNAKVYVELQVGENSIPSNEKLDVVIIREVRVIDHVFTGSVALLVSLLYINFGAALDLSTLKGIVRRPIGPAIGFTSQFLLMPLLSFGLGYVLFPDSVELQLGMFFTGVSPAGAMTAIGNFAAFGMMPLWIFTLGRLIFERGNLVVPYENIATFAVSLVVPLTIGILIQRFRPGAGRILVRLLKPVSFLLILFIIIFAIVTNLYLFQLFSWQIVVAGLGLPWLGYIFGWILAKILKQSSADALTIAIETGIQNTGIAIFLLRFSLPQPQADLTTVVPVCVAIMTPLPLLLMYLWQKIRPGRRDPETVLDTKQRDACDIYDDSNALNPVLRTVQA
ncbi:unnamed protein product [Hermetia illucens]|uniref:Uncharacterized protein n=1 Tax=Hermetia illucens TaxID=343691 RepID=A0A7R8V3L1_HERIL|nr:unnamed protein product [Hermetia illucens]